MRRAVTWQLTVMVAVAASACGSGAAPANPTPSNSSPAGTARPTPTLTTDCSDSSPCSIGAGTYKLGDGLVLPGLTLTVPAGWHSPGNDPGGLSLVPPGKPKDLVAVWDDLNAVKSTGTGHGTTVLTNVGTTPAALIAWMTSNPDLSVVVAPAPATIGRGIKATSLVVGASHSAQYGDPSCTSNPRCADLFSNRALWGGNYVGLVGDEEFHIYLAAITVAGQPQTLFVVLDAPTDAELTQLAATAAPIVDSLQLPADAASS